MTRKKKTRSLKRIHGIKTGNISKLKKAAGTDRQSVRLKSRKKTKSAYQKFLEENPEVAAQERQRSLEAEKQQAEQKALKDQAIADQEDVTSDKKKTEKDEKEDKDLLSQLDNARFDDLY